MEIINIENNLKNISLSLISPYLLFMLIMMG
jgi:hypothetical protein